MIKNTKIKPIYKPVQSDRNWILPKEKNTLFWIFCILKYGESEYLLKNRIDDFIYESEKRYEFAKHLQSDESISLLKAQKIKPIHNNIIDSSSRFDLEMFVGLCIVYNIPIVYLLKHNQYFSIGFTDDLPHVISEKGVYIGDDLIGENDKTKKMYQLSSFNAKLKSITGYKKDELVEIAEKMGIDTTNLKLKLDFYVIISEKFNCI